MKLLKIKGLREMKEGKKELTNDSENGNLNVENEKGKWKLIARIKEGRGLTIKKEWKGNLSLWKSVWKCG